MSILDSGLETANYGTAGWSAIYDSNFEKLDEFILSWPLFSGLNLVYNNANSVYIQPGAAKDDTSGKIMSTDVQILADMGSDLDTGAEANNTWYYVWLIKNEATFNVKGLISLSPTAPTMPAGYTLKKLLGSLRNNNSTNIFEFKQPYKSRINRVKWMEDLATMSVLSGGTSSSYSSVDCSAFVPATAVEVYLRVSNTAATGFVVISVDSSNDHDIVYNESSKNIWLPLDSQTVYYKRQSSGVADIEVLGYAEVM